jgi:cytochrome c5
VGVGDGAGGGAGKAREGDEVRTHVVLVMALSSVSFCAGAQAMKSGEQVYRETCSVCHAMGLANAPKLGDRQAWAPLIKEGQHVLTAHAWVGVRAMPAMGGRPDLALEEFARATAYMARAAGGEWKDPDASMLARIRAEEKKRRESLEHR